MWTANPAETNKSARKICNKTTHTHTYAAVRLHLTTHTCPPRKLCSRHGLSLFLRWSGVFILTNTQTQPSHTAQSPLTDYRTN